MEGAPSAPKAGHDPYGNLLKLSENKCFRLNNLPRIARLLLIFVDLGCFDRYKFDYNGSWPDGNLAKVNLPKLRLFRRQVWLLRETLCFSRSLYVLVPVESEHRRVELHR
jgi:hypothetical protein